MQSRHPTAFAFDVCRASWLAKKWTLAWCDSECVDFWIGKPCCTLSCENCWGDSRPDVLSFSVRPTSLGDCREGGELDLACLFASVWNAEQNRNPQTGDRFAVKKKAAATTTRVCQDGSPAPKKLGSFEDGVGCCCPCHLKYKSGEADLENPGGLQTPFSSFTTTTTTGRLFDSVGSDGSCGPTWLEGSSQGPDSLCKDGPPSSSSTASTGRSSAPWGNWWELRSNPSGRQDSWPPTTPSSTAT